MPRVSQGRGDVEMTDVDVASDSCSRGGGGKKIKEKKCTDRCFTDFLLFTQGKFHCFVICFHDAKA